MYLPNNPIYQRATDNLRAAFAPIWAVIDELVLTVAETDFVWEEQVVYHQLNKSESLAWGLFKDGMRSLTIKRGAEQEELPRFLEAINRARLPAGRRRRRPAHAALGAGVPADPVPVHRVLRRRRRRDAGADRQLSRRRSEDADAARQRQAPGGRGGAAAAQGRGGHGGLRLHALLPRRGGDPPGRAGRSKRSTRRDVRDARRSTSLFDLFELEGEPAIRAEIIGILEHLFPNLLNARDFRTAATVLRESKVLGERAPGLARPSTASGSTASSPS